MYRDKLLLLCIYCYTSWLLTTLAILLVGNATTPLSSNCGGKLQYNVGSLTNDIIVMEIYRIKLINCVTLCVMVKLVVPKSSSLCHVKAMLWCSLTFSANSESHRPQSHLPEKAAWFADTLVPHCCSVLILKPQRQASFVEYINGLWWF